MHFIHVAQLTIPQNRQRKEFEPNALVELMNSISSVGLLQPLVVRRENGEWHLVAGERRLRAIRDLWGLNEQLFFNGEPIDPGMIPVVSIGEADPLLAFEAELEENIRRLDLTWQERSIAITQLHELRQLQAEKEGKIHNVSDTAKEVFPNADPENLGFHHDTTRKSLIVAKYLDDPEVSGAKTLRDAFKILERKEGERVNRELAATVGKTFGGHSHRLMLGDSREWLAQLPAESFDVICTDPPYGMGADEFGDAAGKLLTIDHQYSDSADSFRSLLLACLPLFSRVAKQAAHLYLCCDIDQFHWLREQLTAAGWSVFRTPLINYKQNSGRVPLPNHGPRRTYETILYAFRGGKRCTAIYPDVIVSQGDENLGHGAQKPVSLFTNLLRRSCSPGDHVLDPFAGTGTIFPAAHSLKVYATGIELEPAYYGIAVKRIEALT